MHDCTLLVSSCDKYKEAWQPFFALLKKYWREIENYEIVLSTEKETMEIAGGLNIKYFHYNRSCAWSERLKECLKSIDTKYIIFSLEDFFLQDKVDDGEIARCIKYMEQDSKIAVFYFKKVSDSYMESPYDGYFEATADLKYRINAQVGIWNREILLDILDETENPWEFEVNGSKRLQNSELKFYCHKTSDIYFNIKGPFPYLCGKHNGYGISQGKWLWNNKKLFKKNGIKVNFDNLGVLKPYYYGIGGYAKIRYVCLTLIVRIRNKIISIIFRN